MYERLLVAVDHSEVAPRVIAAAKDLACLSKGKAWVLDIREREFGRLGLTPSEPDEEAQAAVRDGADALIQAGVDAQAEMREAIFGHAAREIVKDAHEHDVDIIIMGSRGKKRPCRARARRHGAQSDPPFRPASARRPLTRPG